MVACTDDTNHRTVEHPGLGFQREPRPHHFRSLTAEYALKAALNPQSPLRVGSAGTMAILQAMHPDVRAFLLQRGIYPSRHQQRRVSAELLHAADLVIAMSTDHQAILVGTFQQYFGQFCLKVAA